MRVLLINSVCGTGSTGRICAEIAEHFEKEGHSVRIAYGRDGCVPKEYRKYAIRIGNDLDVKIHGLKTRLFDAHGLGSVGSTKRFLRWAEEYDPDVLWLHNLHGYYINYELLFKWIKSHPDMQVKWTLHDCWAFTGHCTHFQVVQCQRWKVICGQCCQTKRYPASLGVDNSTRNYCRKRNSFCGIRNLQLIVPSKWMAELVKQSFLKDYPLEIQYNKADEKVFKPTESTFRTDFGILGKTIILGVSNGWDINKGLSDFVELSGLIEDSYKIVLVGLTKKQSAAMPKSILCLPRTNDREKLAEIYSAADYFVNPSKEESFGLTTLEASLCGTPAIVYKGTACEEIAELYHGYAVDQSAESIFRKIKELRGEGRYE